MHPDCETCQRLSNSLQDAVDRLEEARLRVSTLAGSQRPSEFHAALTEVQSLLMEGRAIRAEVEDHLGTPRQD